VLYDQPLNQGAPSGGNAAARGNGTPQGTQAAPDAQQANDGGFCHRAR